MINIDISRVASIYIILITLAWVIVFYAFLRQRDIMKKNKYKYDLRNVRFEVEPIGNETWRLNFYCGHLLHSELVHEVDILNDKAYFYKAFVKWAEEDVDAKQRKV